MKLLMDEHNQQREFLERNMDNEKSRQLMSLADKIAEKKRKRAAALENVHNADNKQQLVEERKERNELLDEQVNSLFVVVVFLWYYDHAVKNFDCSFHISVFIIPELSYAIAY